MLTARMRAVILIVGLVAAAAASFMVAFAQDYRATYRSDLNECTSGPTPSAATATYTVTAVDGRATVAALIEVRFSRGTAEWRQHTDKTIIESCTFANSVSGPGYLGAPDLSLVSYAEDANGDLVITFKSEELTPRWISAYQAANDELAPVDEDDSSLGSSVVDATVGRLDLDVNLCRTYGYRFLCLRDQPDDICRNPVYHNLCDATVPTSINVTVFDSVSPTTTRSKGSADAPPLQSISSPDPPSSLVVDDTAKTTTYTWIRASPDSRIQISIPVHPLLSEADRGTIRAVVPPFTLALQWGNIVANLGTIAALFVAAWLLRRQLRATIPSRAPAAVAVALILVAIGFSTTIVAREPPDADAPPNFVHEVLARAGLSEVWMATMFAVAAVILHRRRPNWRRASGVAATGWMGVLAGTAAQAFVPYSAAVSRLVGEVLVGLGMLAVGGAVLAGFLHFLRLSLLTLPAGRVAEGSAWSTGTMLDSAPWRLTSLRRTVALITIWALGLGLCTGLATAAGRAAATIRADSTISGVIQSAGFTVAVGAAAVALNCVGIIVAGTVVSALTVNHVQDVAPTPARAAALVLTFTMAVAVVPSTPAWADIALPVWPITWILLIAVSLRPPPGHLRQLRGRPDFAALQAAVGYETEHGAINDADSKVASSGSDLAALRTRTLSFFTTNRPDPTSLLLARGPAGRWKQNAKTAAGLGLMLALAPIAYYVWEIAQTVAADLAGILALVAGLLTQTARWVVIAYAYGALYNWIPGRLGVLKGATLAAAWSSSALLLELIGRWIGTPGSGVWLYNSLQILLYLTLLGTLYDLTTVLTAGGTPRRLTEIYRITTWRSRVAYVGPLAIAVAALINELRSGAGANTVSLFIDALTKGLGMG